MIFTLGLGLTLFSCVCVASVAVKAYSCIPPSLAVALRHLFDFLFALTEASCRLVYIVVLFLYNVVTNVLGSVFSVIPIVYKVISFLVSLFLWITMHLVRGLLGLEEKPLNTLSWLLAACVLFLYLENKYQHLWTDIFFRRRTHDIADGLNDVDHHNLDNNHNNNNNNNNNEVLENGTVAGADQLEEIQQLEIENRENENEENALEEADRNRVNNDNARNDQREMIRGDHVDLIRDRVPDPLPVQPARLDDSSDDELDPILCSVCITRRRNVALFPCGHTQLCRECAQIIIGAQRPCPVCQTAIEEWRRVYV